MVERRRGVHGQALLTYTPEPDTPSHQAIQLLASIAATSATESAEDPEHTRGP